MKIKFYICKHCGNIFSTIIDGGVNPVCCGEAMHELVPFEVDGAKEKHVPIVERNGDVILVKVGEVEHPMTENHYIQWIAISSDNGVKIKTLSPNEKPELKFMISSNVKNFTVYAYCNLHGLWKTEV